MVLWVLRDDDDGRRNRCLLCERPFKGSISQRLVCVYVCTYIYIIVLCVGVGVGVCVSSHKLATRCTVVAKTFILFTISPQIPRVKRRPLTKPSLHPPITHETIRSTFGFLRRRR